VLSLSGTGVSPTGTNLAAGKPATASSSTDVYQPGNVTDGNTSSYWESANSAFPQWVQVDLGAATNVSKITLDLPPFTLIGATTRTGLLTTPLRDRFGVSHRLEHYSPEHLALIIERSARILEVEIDVDGAFTIASRSRGTPRVANRLLKRVRDFAQVKGTGEIGAGVAAAALEMLEVDAAGLDRADRALLDTVASKFGGGPVGLSTLAIAIGEEQDTIEDIFEPYLLQQGLLKRTPRGRVLTQRAYDHLGLPAPENAASLF